MGTPSVAQLNARYGIAGQVTFKEGAGGLIVVDVANNKSSASIALQGAHLLTWSLHGQPPVIWLSKAAKFAPGKSVRGGAPICWPWFGAHPRESSYPSHGYARTVPWEVIETKALSESNTHLIFRLVTSDATRALWPHETPVECHVTVGAALEMALVTRNEGKTPVVIGDALHTYFEVGDVRKVKVQGLDGCPYLDKVEDFKRKQQSGAVTIGSEVDRIYLDSTADCLIEDQEYRRVIRIAKRGSRSTVVWNPWIEKANQMGDLGPNGYLAMLCVESTNAADDVVTLAPGAEHRLYVKYSVEPLA